MKMYVLQDRYKYCKCFFFGFDLPHQLIIFFFYMVKKKKYSQEEFRLTVHGMSISWN